ncbi:MAG: hypothetical protein Q9169_000841 [Polycauliona sp. 2 TL-2023]
MPPATKRRKLDGVSANKMTTIAPSKQQGIQAFGRISKSQSTRSPAGKSKSKPIKESPSTEPIPCLSKQTSGSRKRKVQDDDNKSCIKQISPRKRIKSSGKVNTVPSVQRKPTIAKDTLQPKTPRKKTLSKSIPFETPTKGARSFFESLDLCSPTSSKQYSSHPASRTDTPASSPPPESDQESDPELPEELQDLIDLYSSFFTALSLHYAHHGSLTPVDFRQLRPNIERSWGKRKVSVPDIQRIFAFQEDSSCNAATLSLSDYGQSKICIEISTPSTSNPQHKRPLNEEALNKSFIGNLLNKWKLYRISHQAPVAEADFINSLPLAPITACASADTLAPLVAKGQRRLEDLKAGAIKAQARSSPYKSSNDNINNKENEAPQATIDPAIKQKEALTRKTNLFDRIKAKQDAHLLSMANSTPLTPEQVLRQRGLRRLEEIIPVLDLLGSSGNSVIKSFTMPTIVQHLQMSLRNPIEKEEAVRAVRLLAEEVAPAWVGVREIGKLVGVTVRRSGVVGGREEMKMTVKRLIEGF